MSLGILPYVRCNECDGNGLVVLPCIELSRNWGKTGLLNDVESNKKKDLSLCFENIYEDIRKVWKKKTHARYDKAFQNALFVTQKKLHPMTIRYEYSSKHSVHTVTCSNGKIAEFSEEYLQTAEKVYSRRGPDMETELVSIMHSGIIRS